MTTSDDDTGRETPASPVRIRGRDQIRDTIASLCEQAQHRILVLTPVMDAYLFNTARLSQALAGFATRQRHNEARFLVEDARQAVSDNARIVSLCRRLSSFIAMRQIDPERGRVNDMFVVADEAACLLQMDPSRADGTLDLDDGGRARDLTQRFLALWEDAMPVTTIITTGL